MQMPTDYARPALQSSSGAVELFKIDKQQSEALKSWSQKQNATLFMSLLSLIKVLLHRYSHQEDICIGTPIAGRQQHEV